jgi:hypothetical protein
VSLARVGVNVRGRSKRLTVNYRTTQEIFALAVPALGKAVISGLDDEADTLTGYRTPLHGHLPEVFGAATREAELSALVAQAVAWRKEGIEPHAIGVAARFGYLSRQVGGRAPRRRACLRCRSAAGRRRRTRSGSARCTR